MEYNKMWKIIATILGIGRVSLLWWAPFPLPHWVSAVVTLAGGWTYPSSASIELGRGTAPWLGSVGLAVILGTLQLNLQPLHPNLETVHGLDGSLCRYRIVIADEPWEEKDEIKLSALTILGNDLALLTFYWKHFKCNRTKTNLDGTVSYQSTCSDWSVCQ